jgi:hypothetical protein
MSASAVTQAGDVPRNSSLPTPEPRKLRVLEWSVGAFTLCVLAILLATQWESTIRNSRSALAWGILLLIVDLAPVRYSDQMQVTMSLPVLLGAGMILTPTQVALVAFLGSIDPRELRRRISIGRAVFNRSLIALSSLSASAAFHSLGVPVLSWPVVLPVAALCVAIDTTLNWCSVSLAQSFASRKRFSVALRGMIGPCALEFGRTYLSFGLGG